MKKGTKAPPAFMQILVLCAVLLSGVFPLQNAYSASDFRDSMSAARAAGHPVLPGIPAEGISEDSEAATDAAFTEAVSGEHTLPVRPWEISSFDKAAGAQKTQSGFDSFNSFYQGQWKATFKKQGGKVSTLYGSTSKAYDNGPESTARIFLKDSYAMFGLKPDLSDLATRRVDKTPARDHVRFQQTYNGIPVAGVFVLVHSDSRGRVTMVQNDYIEGLQPVNGLVIPADTAMTTARADLEANIDKNGTIFNAKSEALVAPYMGKYYTVWKVTIPTRDPWGLWVYYIDGENGSILYKGNEIHSLKNGSGKVYINNADWHKAKVSTQPLKNLYTDKETTDWGYLWGPRVEVIDNNGNDPWSSTYKFLYSPITQPNWFHATQAYYSTVSIADWWYKQVLSKYGPASPAYFYSYRIPVYVNVIGLCNAYYSSDVTGGGYPGMVFGNEGSCDTYSEDLVVDNDVFRHEFTHAMMDWNGFDAQFGGPQNYYGRAMGEGNADWFAFLNTPKDPLVGDVAWAWSTDGYLRNLDNTRMYPYDVDLPSWGTPEEHYTGEIWGGYLYELYRVLKTAALPYVYNSFYYFSATNPGGHMSSYPDMFDAIWAQAAAEYDLKGTQTTSFKAWGYTVSRGINAVLRAPYSHATNYFYTNAAGSDNVEYYAWRFPPYRTISTTGNLLYSGDVHEYAVIAVNSGMKLTATVTGKTTGLTFPSMDLRTTSGTLVASASGTSTKATLTVPAGVLSSGWYVVRVTGTASSPARGYYNFSVSLN